MTSCKHSHVDEHTDGKITCRADGCRDFWRNRHDWADSFCKANGSTRETTEVKQIQPVIGAERGFLMRVLS